MSLIRQGPGPSACVTPLPRDSQLVKLPREPRDFQLLVDFPTRMNVGDVHSVEVKLGPLEPADESLDLTKQRFAEPLPVRLIVPGSLVVPAEQALEPSPFRTAEATFHIVPLVPGPLAGARVEVLRDGRLEMLDLTVRSQSSLGPRLVFWLTLLVPLLLYLPGRFPEWVASAGVERELAAWLPGIPGRGEFAHQVQNSVALLASAGRNGHLSFFALCIMLATGITLWLWRRPRRATCLSGILSFGPPAPSRPATPPSYLTPVTMPSIS